MIYLARIIAIILSLSDIVAEPYSNRTQDELYE
jgi:hypothetical protein